MKHALNRLLLLSLYLAFITGLTACNSDNASSPEEQIRETLNSIEDAIEARSMREIMKYVSEDYKDHQGYTKNDIRRIMQIQLIRNQKINILTKINSIDIKENIASVELSAAMASRDADLTQTTNRLRANTHRFSLLLKHANDKWSVQSASWQQGW